MRNDRAWEIKVQVAIGCVKEGCGESRSVVPRELRDDHTL